MDSVDSTFFNTSAREEYNEIKSQLWSAIDNHINLSDCEIYRSVSFVQNIQKKEFLVCLSLIIFFFISFATDFILILVLILTMRNPYGLITISSIRKN